MQTNSWKKAKHRNASLCVNSALLIGFNQLEHWQGCLAQLAEMIEIRSRGAAAGCNQFATNSKILITNNYGKPVLTALFWLNSIDLWNYKTGSSIGTWDDIPLELPIIVENLTNGLEYCPECRVWWNGTKIQRIHQIKMIHYSFAGVACENCYNPKIHEKLDTRGD